MSGPRAVAVVIGRAGSKGLPGKNTRILVNRPMVEHTIGAAIDARRVGRVVVSSDCDRIKAVAESMAVELVDRPADLATDTTPVDEVVRHAVQTAGGDEAIIVILYANVPVRPVDLIDRAVERLAETGADSVRSFSDVGKHHPLWMASLDADGRVQPFVENTTHRRQDLPRLLVSDGGVIAVTPSSLYAGRADDPHAFLGTDRRGIESPPGSVVDVDTPGDFALAESILRRPIAQTCRVTIGSREIGPSEPPFVIAELGVNHDGSLARALELVEAAAGAGADGVKLQWFEAERLLSRAARLARYQQAAGAGSPLEMLSSLELDAGQIAAVLDKARGLELAVVVTVFSEDHVRAAQRLDFDAFKTASPDIVNRPLIEALMSCGKPLIVSTGGATMEEIRAVTAWLGDHPHLLMQCVSAYPTPDECAALAGRAAMGAINPNALGYSDHTTAVDTGALAVASGACLLEKHLTHDRRAAGPDHAMSLDPGQFYDYVKRARRAHSMLGPQVKTRLPIEEEVQTVSRQSVTAREDLAAGHVLTRRELAVKRPGTGIPPSRLNEIIGRRLARSVQADMPLVDEDLE